MQYPNALKKVANIQIDEFPGRRNLIFGVDVHKIESKKLYSKFVAVIEQKATCISNWNRKYNIIFSEEQWKFIFLLPKAVTQSTKLQELQLKITHRIYATDSYVNNFDKSVDMKCCFCDVKNNIIHWFAECCMLNLFLKLLEKWLKVNFCPLLQLDPITIIFGCLDKHAFIVNYCLLHAKLYIHNARRKCKDKTKLYFSFTCFLKRLKNAVNIEKQIATNKSSLTEYETKFHMLEYCF